MSYQIHFFSIDVSFMSIFQNSLDSEPPKYFLINVFRKRVDPKMGRASALKCAVEAGGEIAAADAFQ